MAGADIVADGDAVFRNPGVVTLPAPGKTKPLVAPSGVTLMVTPSVEVSV